MFNLALQPDLDIVQARGRAYAYMNETFRYRTLLPRIDCDELCVRPTHMVTKYRIKRLRDGRLFTRESDFVMSTMDASHGIRKTLRVKMTTLATAMHTTGQRLFRRLRANRVPADMSDHLVRIARVFHAASNYLGEAEASRWLGEPNRALGNAVPLRVLCTADGERKVGDVIEQIQRGAQHAPSSAAVI